MEGGVFFFFFYLGRAGGSTEKGALQPPSSQLLQNPRRPVSRKAIMWQRWGDSQGFQSRIVNSERTTSGEAGSGVQAGTVEDKKRHELHSYIKHHSGEEWAGGSVHSETETLLVCQHSLREEHAWEKKLCSVALKAEDETLNCSPAIAISPSATITIHIFFLSAQARWSPTEGVHLVLHRALLRSA